MSVATVRPVLAREPE